MSATKLFITLYLTITTNKTFSTIDINASELKYISDHLDSESCRKLVAASHFPSFELPNALSEAELRVSKDLSCFELLLHWNSSPGEGKGRSHEMLERRLRQLGKNELADWLGKTVFQEMGEDLKEAIDEEFKEMLNDTTTYVSILRDLPTVKYREPTEWLPIDSVLFAILFFLSLALVGVCCRIFYIYTCGKIRNVKGTTSYRKLDFSDSSGSESEDRFDYRKIRNMNNSGF